MNKGGWYSKKSIMKDLAQVTGSRHIHDSCFVVGDTPPPRQVYHGDPIEVRHRFGDVSDVPQDVQTPDLNGIREMLRMVDNETVDKPRIFSGSANTEPENILVITKLNPEVKEFVPSSMTKSKNLKENGSQTHSNGDNVISNADKKCVKNGNTTSPVDDIKEMREKLKTKILDNSKSNCITSKRERNLAMASLLKLLSKAPEVKSNVKSTSSLENIGTKNSEPGNKNEPIRLLTPGYYESTYLKKEATEKPAVNEEVLATVKHKSINDELKMNKTLYNSDSSIRGSNATSIYGKLSKTNVLSIENDDQNSNTVDIQNSLEKVTTWLDNNEKESRKEIETVQSNSTPAGSSSTDAPKVEKKSTSGASPLFLGPVTFKRKNVKSNSPSTSSELTVSKMPTKSYVPSAYASQLSNSYAERAKVKTDLESNIMTRLYAELDRRDEEHRRKLEEAEAAKLETTSEAVENATETVEECIPETS